MHVLELSICWPYKAMPPSPVALLSASERSTATAACILAGTITDCTKVLDALMDRVAGYDDPRVAKRRCFARG